MNIEFSLEVPITKKEANQKGLNESLCKLFIQFDKKNKDYYPTISRIVGGNRPDGKYVCITSIGEFKLIRDINASNKDIFFNYEQNFCATKDVSIIEDILCVWDAESLVLYYSTIEDSSLLLSKIKKSYPKTFEFTKMGYETSYLSQIDHDMLFLFYSESRSAIDIFGNKKSIMEFFYNSKKYLD